jgi:transposase
MAKTFRTYLPEQNLLLPASLREWLPDDHLSYFVSDVVDQLDLSAIERVYEEERGQPPYHPRMMTKILLDSWRRESRSTVNGENPASEGPYREKPAGSSAWNESWKPR